MNQRKTKNISESLPDDGALKHVVVKGAQAQGPLFLGGGTTAMKLTEQERESVMHQFDCFCKKVLKLEAKNYIRHVRWKEKHEIPIFSQPCLYRKELSVEEEYPSDFFHFLVGEYDIAVKNERLAKAIEALSEEKRVVILLAYFLDMSDPEIAEQLHIVRRTVQYRRMRSLKELQKRMEEGNEKKEVQNG